MFRDLTEGREPGLLAGEQMLGAQAIVEALKKEGVTFVAGFPGQGTEKIISVLHDTPEIQSILTRHERVAMDIIDGYARVKGEPGVALASAGPGAAHAFAGLGQSASDCVPVLLLQGQVPQRALGTDATQEMDILAAFRPVTKWQIRVNHVERIPEVMRRAFTALRSGRGGPVVLELPRDVTEAEAPADKLAYRPVRRRYRSAPDPEDVGLAADILLGADNPVIYAGAGVLWAEAWQELLAIAELLTIPVMTTLNGKSAFPEDHPLSLGLGGFPMSRLGTLQAYEVAKETDVLLAVGNRFRPRATGDLPWPPDVKLIHVDVDPCEIGKVYPADCALVGDAKLALGALLDALRSEASSARQKPRNDILEQIAVLRKRWWDRLLPKMTSQEAPINPYRLTYELMQTLDRRQTIMIHDAGFPRGHVSHVYESLIPRGYLGMGGQSEMGWSLGAAMGAKLAQPELLVVHVIGDGAFGMTGMDLETAVRCQIPILTILSNNSSLGITKSVIADGKYHMVNLTGNYAQVAEGLGAYGERVEDPDEIGPAVYRALDELAQGRPALLEFITAPWPMPSIR
jgi:thiamine pyrophosphate-dependent acetolactate synthase large subunit-like protein